MFGLDEDEHWKVTHWDFSIMIVLLFRRGWIWHEDRNNLPLLPKKHRETAAIASKSHLMARAILTQMHVVNPSYLFVVILHSVFLLSLLSVMTSRQIH